MIKNILFFSFFLLSTFIIDAQQPPVVPIYNVSLKLTDSIKAYLKIKDPTGAQQLRMYEILGSYLLETNQLKTVNSTIDIQRAFRGNIFIHEILKENNFWEFAEPISMFSGDRGIESAGKKSILSKVGNLNATIFADAFAKIIVKRFKQDLNVLFFRKMKREMESSLELKTLFPNTYGGLTLMDKDIYVFEQYIAGLRQKMEEDLANVFANTTELLETEKYAKAFKGNQTTRDFLTTATQFADGLIKNQHPGHIIENLHFSDAFDEGEGQDLRAGLQTIQLISTSFRSSNAADSTHYWINSLDSLNLLVKGDALAAQVWLGSVYQLAVDDKGKPITFQNNQTLRHYINGLYDKKDNFYQMRNYVQGLVSRINMIEMSNKDMRLAQNNDGKFYWDKMVSSYENILSLVKFVPTIKEILEPETALPRTWYKGIFVAEMMPRIYAEMKGREYHAAVQHIAELVQAVDARPMYVKEGNNYIRIDTMSTFFQPNTTNRKVPVRAFKSFSGTYIMKDKKPVVIDKLYVDDDSLGKKPLEYTRVQKFIKYSSFAASMVLAQSSDEVAFLLESTMTPPGGTYIKEKGWLMSVNSYIGLQNTFRQKDSSGYFSIAAPIGINISYGLKSQRNYPLSKKQKFADFITPHTIQFFASLVDVGAIAGFRFSNTTDSIPKIKLSNIFSPGLFIMFGRMFNSPINIGLGYQAQPRLYAVKEETIFLKKFEFRFNINLCWDIPFWHLAHWDSK